MGTGREAFRRVWLPAALCLLALACAALALGPEPAWAQPRTFAPIVRTQRAKVVHITTSLREQGTTSSPSQPFRFPDANRGSGSGFIINEDGFIVTNFHVVENADLVEVVLADERKFEAEIVGLDPQTDLALIKIGARDLPSVKFGDSSILEVGDWVLAIGNPLGLDHTVTAGIISAKGRNIFNEDNLAYGEFLQTDAAINPGNSGGPLFNLDGEVVGVNSAISRRGQGIGFAVPSNLVVQIVDQLRQHGRVRRGWLGVVILEVNPEMAQQLTLPSGTKGVLIDDIVAGSPALAAGLRKGDVLTGFGSEALLRVAQLQKLVALSGPGREVDVKGLRRDRDGDPWKPLRVHLRIGANAAADAGQVPVFKRIGIVVGKTPVAAPKGGAVAPPGIRVDQVVPGGAAEEAGLLAGDVIVEANRTEVKDIDALESTLKAARNERIPFVVRRQDRVLYFVIVMSAVVR